MGAIEGDGQAHVRQADQWRYETAPYMRDTDRKKDRYGDAGAGKRTGQDADQSAGHQARQEGAGHHVGRSHLTVDEQLPRCSPAGVEQPAERVGKRLVLCVLYEQARHGPERQPVSRRRLIQRNVLALPQGRIKRHKVKDLPPVERVTASHRSGMADNLGHEPGCLKHVRDIPVRDRGTADRIVTCERRLGPEEPVAGKDDVRVDSRDELTLRRPDSGGPGISSTAILRQIDQIDTRVPRCSVGDDVRSSIT